MPSPPLTSRRRFVTLASMACAGLAINPGCALSGPGPLAGAGAPRGLPWLAGPQLLLDDFLIETSVGLTTELTPPTRLPHPVLDHATFATTQPYVGIAHDPDRGRFRLWYNRGYTIALAESTDGIRWEPRGVVWDIPRAFGSSVVDEGTRARDPSRRFKIANWQATPGLEDTARDDSGLWVGFSSDGLTWHGVAGNPVLRRFTEGVGVISRDGVNDIVDAYWDPIRQWYGCAVKVMAGPEEMTPGPRGSGARRLVGLTTSRDFVNWSRPERIFVPDASDQGLTEFYGMAGVHARGPLLIGFVRVLRDDLSPEPGGPADGIGYTVLATSRDGLTWRRQREVFFDRNPQPGTWDRAMTWGAGALPVGNELFLYYGGYARGHRVGNQTERQIGLARVPRDRYMARVGGADGGVFRTPPVRFDGSHLTVNARVDGDLRVAVLDAAGRPITGFAHDDCAPVRGDALTHPVSWTRPVSRLRHQAVRLEFTMREARLYAFEMVDRLVSERGR